jgi:hypothetical protein
MLITSWLSYIGFLVIVHYRPEFNSVATMAVVFFSGKFYLNFFLVIVTCAMIDFTTYSYNTLFTNNLAGALMVLVKERGYLNEKTNLPYIVAKALKKYDIYKKEDDENKIDILGDDVMNSRVSSYRDLAFGDKGIPMNAGNYQSIPLQKINPYLGSNDYKKDFNVDTIKIASANKLSP